MTTANVTDPYTNRSRIRAAIINTRNIQQPEGYWKNLVASRTQGTGLGSYYDLPFEEIEDLISNTMWRPSASTFVSEGCIAFEADLLGFMNVIELSELDDDAEGTLEDPKGTGNMELHVSGSGGVMTSVTTCILGIHEGMEVVFTFHPGEPIRPSVVVTDPNKIGKTITVAEARILGLSHAKVVVTEPEKKEGAGPCGFCGALTTRVEGWPGQDGCCWYDIKVCQSCGRKEAL